MGGRRHRPPWTHRARHARAPPPVPRGGGAPPAGRPQVEALTREQQRIERRSLILGCGLVSTLYGHTKDGAGKVCKTSLSL